MSSAKSLRVVLVQTQAENAGAQEISRLVAQGLTAQSHDVRQLFFFRRTGSFDDAGNAVFLCANRPNTIFGILKLLWRAFSAFRTMKPDAVITFQHYGNIIAAPVARVAGVKTIIANQVSAAATVSSPVRIADKMLGRTGFYSKIIVNSTETEASYSQYPASYSRRLMRIDHGFSDKSSTIAKDEARKLLDLPPDVPMLGCAARLHPLKCLDHAIRILPVNQDQHLVLAGQGEDEQRLRALSKALDVADRVHFLGELDLKKMGVFLAALDCFVFPSSAETFGLAPVEAAQAGVPVVSNSLPILREVIQVNGKDCALFVDTSDTKAFAAAVQSIFDDKTLEKQLIDNSQLLAQRYPLDAMVDAYVTLVEELCSRDAR